MKVVIIEDAIETAGFGRVPLAITKDRSTGEPRQPSEECHQERFASAVIGDMFEDSDHGRISAGISTKRTKAIAMNANIACQTSGIE